MVEMTLDQIWGEDEINFEPLYQSMGDDDDDDDDDDYE